MNWKKIAEKHKQESPDRAAMNLKKCNLWNQGEMEAGLRKADQPHAHLTVLCANGCVHPQYGDIALQIHNSFNVREVLKKNGFRYYQAGYWWLAKKNYSAAIEEIEKLREKGLIQ